MASKQPDQYPEGETPEDEYSDEDDEKDEPSDVLFITKDGKCFRNRKSSLTEDAAQDDFFNPSGRNDVAWCVVVKEEEGEHESAYGKWLVFKDYDKISATWRDIVNAIREEKLESCSQAKCSTLFYNPLCAGPGPSTKGVICVYTGEDDMDNIGYKLIQLVKQDIKYKTDEDTLNYKYAHVGAKATIQTLYYNQGHPSTELTGERAFGTTQNMEDIWHVNEVINPSLRDDEDYGRWILTLEYKELTHLWQILKRKIKSGQMKALRMVCPPKRRRSSSDEKPIFHVYTNEENAKEVGSVLILKVCRDITYEKKSGYPQYRTLFWNKGEYSYEKITRKGITKNWRTGEEM